MGFSATHRRPRRWLACVPLLCTLAPVPAAALARTPRGGVSGGAGLDGGGGTSTAATTPATGLAHFKVVRVSGVVNASGDGITLTVAASGTQGHPLTIAGHAAGEAGATVVIEAARPGGPGWNPVATAVIGSTGIFGAKWTPAASAQVDLRAVLAPRRAPAGGSGAGSGGTWLPGGSSASTASGELETAPLTIPIFRNGVATIYGPGFWGHRTACGERLTRASLGVASRSLRCGTRVGVFYRGHEITVPVIDRGPFANRASWDLTMATARALSVKETVTVGTLAPAPSRR
jgi:hypothetical protein